MTTEKDIRTAQAAFFKSFEDKAGAFISSHVDGKFRFIKYPSGFHYQLVYGPNGYYNQSTLQELDLAPRLGADGYLVLNSGRSFSGMYQRALELTTFKLSTADQARMQESLTRGQAQEPSVIASFEANFGPIGAEALTSAKPPTKIGVIMAYIAAQYGGDPANCPFADFRVAYQQWRELSSVATTLSQAQVNGGQRIQAALNNTKHPSARNGGFQTDASAFHVGFTGLPSATELSSYFDDSNAGRAIAIDATMTYQSTQESTFSIGGGADLVVPLEFLQIDASVGVGANAKYTLHQLHSLAQSMTVSLKWTCVSIVGSSPALLGGDGETGWYDGDMIHQIAMNSGHDVTGFAIDSDGIDTSEYFGAGGEFARLRTLVLSRPPTVTLVFHKAELSRVEEFFHEDLSVNLYLFNCIPVGSAEESYTTSSVKVDDKSGDVIVTFLPPKISGTVPVQQQTCYVLGGVIDHPA